MVDPLMGSFLSLMLVHVVVMNESTKYRNARPNFARWRGEDKSKNFCLIVLFSEFAEANLSDVKSQKAKRSIMNTFLNRVSKILNVTIDPPIYSIMKNGLS